MDGGRSNPLLGSRLHDFGFRGCTCMEQARLPLSACRARRAACCMRTPPDCANNDSSPNAQQSVIGGVAHLLNFDGSDTMSAAYYAQFVLNGGQPVAQSIPATEHRQVMHSAHTAAPGMHG